MGSGQKLLAEATADVAAGRVLLTAHALRRSVERDISMAELREAAATFEVVEAYPHDKYAPSVLLLGFTRRGRPIHVQLSLKAGPAAIVVTLYEPDPLQWVNHRTRL